jgi:acylphosphatase
MRADLARPSICLLSAAAYVSISSVSMKARAHIVVSGRVQGVFFRDHTRRWAGSLGLTGWVRNLWDGRVEVLTEGEKDRIETLISRLKQGPPLAQVEDVNVTWEEFLDEFVDFLIAWR